jgi:hypothetical protein
VKFSVNNKLNPELLSANKQFCTGVKVLGELVQDLVKFVGKPNNSPFSLMISSSSDENKSEEFRSLLVWHLICPFSSSCGAKDK